MSQEKKGGESSKQNGEKIRVQYEQSGTSATDIMDELSRSDTFPADEKVLEMIEDTPSEKFIAVEQRSKNRPPKKGLFNSARNLLAGIGLLSAVGSGAAYIQKTDTARQESSSQLGKETNKADESRDRRWNETDPVRRLSLKAQDALPLSAAPEDIEPRIKQVGLLEEELENAPKGIRRNIVQAELRQLKSESVWSPEDEEDARAILEENFKVGLGNKTDMSVRQLADLSPERAVQLPREVQELREKYLQTRSGWANPERQKVFNRLLNKASIREKLSSADVSVAGAFSLLKATIGTTLDITSAEAEKKLGELIKERQELSKKKILGPDTKHVIVFSYGAEKGAAETFKGKEIVKMTKVAMGVEENAKDPRITFIETSRVKDKTKTNAGDLLLKSIEGSSGSTYIHIATHAGPQELVIDAHDIRHPTTLKYDGIALAFVNRLLKEVQEKGVTAGKDSLKQMTVFIDGCKSHNLSRQIASAIKGQYSRMGLEKIIGIDSADIGLPTIITSSGEDSPTLTFADENLPKSGSRALTEKTWLKRIQDAGGLTGKLMFELEAESYISGGDMGFFVDKQGRFTEISQLEQKPPSTAAV